MIGEFAKEHRNIKVISYHGHGDALMNQEEDFVFYQLPIDEKIYDHRSMVEAGVGISLVPEISWSLEKTDHVSLVPLSSHPSRSLVIAWKKGKTLTKEQKLFLDYVCKWFS